MRERRAGKWVDARPGVGVRQVRVFRRGIYDKDLFVRLLLQVEFQGGQAVRTARPVDEKGE